VDHIDDRVGCGGEFIGVIVAKRVAAEIAVSVVVIVVMVGSGGESFGGGLGEDSAQGLMRRSDGPSLSRTTSWTPGSRFSQV
jgi:hypothetical protein